MSVACFCPSKVFAAMCSMPKKEKKTTKPCATIRVACSSPHGQLVYIEIHPQMFVSDAKAAVMLHVPEDISVLSINADWAEIQAGCPAAQRIFRFCTYDGDMLQDHLTFSAQMTSYQMQTLYKLVWMKQYNFTQADRVFMYNFADSSKGIDNLGIEMN